MVTPPTPTSTGYVLLGRVPHHRTTAPPPRVAVLLALPVRRRPAQLVRSLTWYQSAETAAHARFTLGTDQPAFLAYPHSPWQRGSIKDTNGLLGQYLPRSADLSARRRADLDDIAACLTGRPRAPHDWATPPRNSTTYSPPTPLTHSPPETAMSSAR